MVNYMHETIICDYHARKLMIITIFKVLAKASIKLKTSHFHSLELLLLILTKMKDLLLKVQFKLQIIYKHKVELK